jgi:Tfp pilus assembly protein PilF
MESLDAHYRFFSSFFDRGVTEMISQVLQTCRPQRWFSFSCSTVLMALLALTAQAQMGGVDPEPHSLGTGGRSVIEGRIFYPSGRNVDRRFRVKLVSIRGGDMTTLADDTGAFAFRRLAAGTYTVTVEVGSEYEPVNEQVDVSEGPSARGSRSGLTYSLTLQLRLKKGNTGPASVINAALAGVPEPAAALYLKALESERAGDDKKALDQLQQAIALYSEFSLALNETGLIYQRLGQLDKALAAFSDAVKVAPEVAELRLNYGIVLFKNKQYADAEMQLQRAIALKDGLTQAHFFRAKTLILLGRNADAEKELQQVIKLGGGEAALAYRYLGALYKDRGENKLAVEALETYLSLAPKAKDADSVRAIIKQLRSQETAKH